MRRLELSLVRVTKVMREMSTKRMHDLYHLVCFVFIARMLDYNCIGSYGAGF